MADDEQKHLPLFKSPLLTDYDTEYRPQPGVASHEKYADSTSRQSDVRQSLTQSDRTSLNETPFQRHEKVPDSELFYDLFFVANLTVFTYEHEINSSATLKQHIGFFCILWFTWYHVGLYNIRFSVDSIFERVMKAIQFLVMIAFASVGPNFNPGEQAMGDMDGAMLYLYFFRGLTLSIMVSRLVLAVQYLVSTWFSREHKQLSVPLGLIASTYLAAAFVYLGLYWAFFHVDPNGGNNWYIGWYIVAILETVFVTAVSSIWRQIAFKGTPLVERMSLLTLIILGEGAIAIAKACQNVAYSDGAFQFTGTTIAQIVCATLNLYFIYIIYFDWIHEEHFGTIRQQIWSFIHFPLHVALVLAVLAASHTIVWCAAIMRADELYRQFDQFDTLLFNSSSPNTNDFMEGARSLNMTAETLLRKQLEVSGLIDSTLEGFAYLIISQRDASDAIANGTTNSEAANNAFWWLWGNLYNTIFKIAGFYHPDTDADPFEIAEYIREPYNFTTTADFKQTAKEDMSEGYFVYMVTFGYFFISTGLTVICCVLLAYMSTRDKSSDHVIRLTVSGLIGIGLCLVSILCTNHKALDKFTMSPWVLPTVTLSLFVVVIVNSVKPTLPAIYKGRIGNQKGYKSLQINYVT